MRLIAIESEEANEIKLRFCHGIPSETKFVKVLWIGNHLALVQKKGENAWVGRGTIAYRPNYVEIVDKATSGVAEGIGRQCFRMVVHEGRITKALWSSILIAAKNLDEGWPEELARREKKSAEEREIEESKARYQETINKLKDELLDTVFDESRDIILVSVIAQQLRSFIRDHPDKKA